MVTEIACFEINSITFQLGKKSVQKTGKSINIFCSTFEKNISVFLLGREISNLNYRINLLTQITNRLFELLSSYVEKEAGPSSLTRVLNRHVKIVVSTTVLKRPLKWQIHLTLHCNRYQ